MLYDQFGRPINDDRAERPRAGMMFLTDDSDRSESDASRGLTPAKVDAIMRAANRGDVAEQCRLSMEIEEKNWDVAHALQTRRAAVRGVKRTIEPGDDSPRAKAIAEEFEKVVGAAGKHPELDSFDDLIADLTGALVPGFAASEIVWESGDAILGFRFVEQRHFVFRGGSRIPLLVAKNHPEGIPAPYAKMVYHNHRVRSGDPARGGLIRPLSWLHSFANVNVKDLLRFIERHGMPFVIAKVDESTWDNERNKIKALIRSFGPDGGGVFTKATELELLQAANNTGDVYFKMLEYFGAAVTKVVLGQTATAGDGGGWSKDDAQSQVRQDILEADCDAVADTIRVGVATPWTLFNHGADAPAPKVKFHYEPPEDLKRKAEIVEILNNGGLETDDKEMSEAFGMKLTRRKTDPPSTANPDSQNSTPKTQNPRSDSTAMSASNSETISTKPPSDWLRSLASFAVLALAADAGDDDEMEILAKNAVEELRKSGGAAAWLGEMQRKIAAAADDPDAKAAMAGLAKFADGDPDLMDVLEDSKLAETLEKTIFAAAATGKAEKVGALKKNEGGE